MRVYASKLVHSSSLEEAEMSELILLQRSREREIAVQRVCVFRRTLDEVKVMDKHSIRSLIMSVAENRGSLSAQRRS